MFSVIRIAFAAALVSFLPRFGRLAGRGRGGELVLYDLVPIIDKAGGFRLVHPVQLVVVKDIEVKTLGSHLPRSLGRQYRRGFRDGKLVVGETAQKAVFEDGGQPVRDDL